MTAGKPQLSRPLAVTCGEPAGIGAEITLDAWAHHTPDSAPFFVIDQPARLAQLGDRLGRSIPIAPITRPEDVDRDLFDEALPVLPLAEPIRGSAGAPDPRDAGAIVASIKNAVSLVRAGRAAAVVTNPIGKASLKAVGHDHPGHTEFLAELGGTGDRPVMLLASPALKVVPVTIHMPLSAVPGHLSRDLIVETARLTHQAFQRDFACPRPRLAILGLNPHAGEAGLLGTEEDSMIRPAIALLQAAGIDAFGPVPPDAAFHAKARKGFDVAICMYHDQALIPLKTLDFDEGVNVTLNLPFIRTSPDHGTALDIAGKGIANPQSLIAALKLAADMAEARAARPT